LGSLSPVDCRIMCSVCHPVVERSWKDSARSWWVATRQRSISSSCGWGRLVLVWGLWLFKGGWEGEAYLG
jgi:hypothetical protein